MRGLPLHGRTRVLRVHLVRETRSSSSEELSHGKSGDHLWGGVMLGVTYRGRQLRIGGAKAGPVEIVCILLTFGYMGFLVWTAAKRNGLA